MAKTYSNKINKIRSFALALIFVGFVIMYGGIFFRESPIIMLIFISLGMIALMFSMVVYFWIGMLSTKAIVVTCPNCEKPTKILGRVDMCMHCREPLTLDPDLEGEEFSEEYNKKNKKIQTVNKTE
ncbi:YgzB family protein [Jeotgalibacillus proteolyticus]|uniref:YgzB family protein n=1 Tax=Jeotgalibacillus proteolyticus TaxID=2082395 RepID=UPI003CF84BE0